MADIDNPVDLTLHYDELANNPQDESEDWNLPCYNEVKAFIKQYYSIIQEDFCIYCRIALRFGGYGEPIEHIVPKKDRPHWMFEPRNLALSCYPCNTKKNADNTLSAGGLALLTYPVTSDGFSIYHPHFDIWTHHFSIFHQYFILPVTAKGRETFAICELYRMNLPLDKAKQRGFMEEDFQSAIISQALLDPLISAEIREQCQQISNEIIFRDRVRRGVQNI